MRYLSSFIVVLCLAFSSNCSLINAQILFPELIFENDGLELDESYTVTYTDAPLNPEDFTLKRIIDNTGLLGVNGLPLHDFNLFDNTLTDFYAKQGYVIELSNGSAAIMVELEEVDNPENRLVSYYKLQNGRSWEELEETATEPFSYRNDLGYDVDYESWNYYVMDENNSFVYGAGDLNGSLLQLRHSPVNFFFYYQIGIGNAFNQFSDGATGWCKADGSLVISDGNGGQTMELAIDVSAGFDHTLVADYGSVVLRTYTITDADGNEFSQEMYQVVESICPGDFDLNGAVSSADLGFLLADFGCMVNCPTDITADGAVQVNDMAAFLSIYGLVCPD